METIYHSQFDNDEYYNADVFRFHHELYGLLVMAFDRVNVAPGECWKNAPGAPGERQTGYGTGGREELSGFCWSGTAEAKKIADEVYRKVKEINDVKNAGCCMLYT